MSRGFVLSTVLSAALASTSAQQPPAGVPDVGRPTTAAPQAPPRDVRPGEDPQKGSSVIRGFVTAAGTTEPLRRALVRAVSQEGRGGGMAVTDAQGRFEITELTAGRYQVTASKAGYVSMSYGQRRPEQAGTLIGLLERQIADRIAMALPRGGVITGAVLDEFGEPVAGAQVSALRFRYFNGARRLVPSGTGGTDDRGVFRIYGLAPGDYYVSAGLRAPQQTLVNQTTGSVPTEGYAPTYFPGTTTAGEAERLTVRAGQETTNISFGLVAARLVRVSGRALNSAGSPIVQGMITMMPADRFASAVIVSMTNAVTRADGTFQIAGVAPGTYTITLRPRGLPTPDAEFANVRVTVGQTDLDALQIVTARGGIAVGTVTTDDGTPLPLSPQQVVITARPTDPDQMALGGNSQVNADWTFEITGLSEARVITAAAAENQDWTFKAVLHNGLDVTDAPIEFLPGRTLDGLQVIFSRKRTEISGQITGSRDAPDTDATVIVFADDPTRWGFGTRYIRTARPSQDGRYTLRGMPPHDYLVVAVRNVEAGQWQDPEFLDSVRAQAVRVTLTDGATQVQDLKVSQ